MSNEQANDRRTSGETYRPSNKKNEETSKRAKERPNDRMNERTNEPTDYERSDRRIFKHLLRQPDIFSALFVVNDHVKDSVTLLSELNTDRFPFLQGSSQVICWRFPRTDLQLVCDWRRRYGPIMLINTHA